MSREFKVYRFLYYTVHEMLTGKLPLKGKEEELEILRKIGEGREVIEIGNIGVLKKDRTKTILLLANVNRDAPFMLSFFFLEEAHFVSLC